MAVWFGRQPAVRLDRSTHVHTVARYTWGRPNHTACAAACLTPVKMPHTCRGGCLRRVRRTWKIKFRMQDGWSKA